MPGIAAIQQDCIGAICSNGVDDRRHPVEAADLAISLRKRAEIASRQGVMRGAAIVDAVELTEIRAGNMRHGPLVFAHADIDRRLAEIDRFELSVDVGDVDQADIAKGVELQKLFLSQRLLRRQFRPVTKGRCPKNGRSSHARLKKITPRDHDGPFQLPHLSHADF